VKELAKEGVDLNQPFKCSRNAQTALDVLANQFPYGALRQEWLTAWQEAKGGARVLGASEDTFDRAKDELLGLGEVEADGKGKGAIYRAKSTTAEPRQDAPQDSPHSATPIGVAEECGGKKSANDPQCGGNAEDVTASCEFGDTTETHSEIPSEAVDQPAAHS